MIKTAYKEQNFKMKYFTTSILSLVRGFQLTSKPLHIGQYCFKTQEQLYVLHYYNQKRVYSSNFSRILNHSEKKVVPVPVDIMYDVVCDVENYKEFVPWCTKSIVKAKTSKTAKAELAVGFGPVQEHYKSTLVFNKPKYIKSICSDGKLFNMLDCTWKFLECPKTSSTIVTFDVQFEFRSIMYTKLAQVFFDEVVKKMVSAFEKRALHQYRTKKHVKKS